MMITVTHNLGPFQHIFPVYTSKPTVQLTCHALLAYVMATFRMYLKLYADLLLGNQTIMLLIYSQSIDSV